MVLFLRRMFCDTDKIVVTLYYTIYQTLDKIQNVEFLRHPINRILYFVTNVVTTYCMIASTICVR